MKDSVIRNKSKVFALDIIALYKSLCEEKREFVLSKQILRSGTSIGANVVEASNAQTDADFLAKMYIALKEAGETQYWLELLFESDYIDKNQFEKLNGECFELVKLLTSTTKTLKERMSMTKKITANSKQQTQNCKLKIQNYKLYENW